jgi:hypothetical protein
MGFQIIINMHGEVVEVKQPGNASTDEDDQ